MSVEIEARLQMRQFVQKRLYYVFVLADIEAAEVGLAASTAWWAYVLTRAPEHLLELPFHIAVLTVAPFWMWAAVWWVTFICVATGIITGWLKLRRAVMLWLVFAWGFTGATILQGQVFSIWSGESFILSVTSLWAFLRLRMAERNLKAKDLAQTIVELEELQGEVSNGS